MQSYNVTVITTCSSRKMRQEGAALDLRAVYSGSSQEVLYRWVWSIKNTTIKPFPAHDVYKGRAFQEARKATELVDGDLYIVSAGFGLLRSVEAIPPYDLSITGGGNNDVRKKVQGIFLGTDWWAGINRSIRGDEAPISSLVRSSQKNIFVFALSSAYYRLIEKDLLTIPSHERIRLRFLGMGLGKVLNGELSEYLLPYNERFDGPDSPIRGTRGDFAQRAARHFIGELVARGIVDLKEQKRRIIRLQDKWRKPEQPSRESMNDEEILAFLWETAQKNSPGGSTRMLRTFRNMGYRCEQKRFAALYRKVTAGGDERSSK